MFPSHRAPSRRADELVGFLKRLYIWSRPSLRAGPSHVLKSVPVHRLLRHSGPAALLVFWSLGVALAASLTAFTAAFDGTRVRVEWEVSTETDVTGFDLARKAAAETSYTPIGSVVPTGQRRYQYFDTNVFRPGPGGASPSGPAGATSGLSGGPFTYRLTVRGPGGDQSYLTVPAGTPSAVQRSWGTIKSMFR